MMTAEYEANWRKLLAFVGEQIAAGKTVYPTERAFLAVEAERNHWRARAEASERELAALKARLEGAAQQVDDLGV